MTEQLTQPMQGIKESPAVEAIFERLDANGKKLFLGMSHFAPETGGTKEAVLATCAMNEEEFQKAAEELKQVGLLVRGNPGIVRKPIPLRQIDPKRVERTLARCLERGLINQEEAERARSDHKAYVHRLKVGERSKFSMPAKRGIIEDPNGNRYGLKRQEEIQKFLKESGISSG